MFQKTQFKSYLFTAVALTAILLMIGCAAKKPFWGNPKSGLILEYRISDGLAMTYQNTTNMLQNVEMVGQSNTNMDLTFSAKSKGIKDNKQMLGITIDDLSIKVESQQGNLNPDMSSVIGKNFDMNLSFLGKELNFDGAKKIKFSMGPQGDRDLYSQFQNIFPDMAGKPLKIGDTWTTHDTIDIDEGGVILQMLFDNLNTLTGFETVDGFDCAKVTAKIKGTLSGQGSQGGADFDMEGDIEADDVWYFAYKKGFIVKHNSDSFTEGTVNLTSPQEMSLPMTMEVKVENKLLK